jgi:hypothetical protein
MAFTFRYREPMNSDLVELMADDSFAQGSHCYGRRTVASIDRSCSFTLIFFGKTRQRFERLVMQIDGSKPIRLGA